MRGFKGIPYADLKAFDAIDSRVFGAMYSRVIWCADSKQFRARIQRHLVRGLKCIWCVGLRHLMRRFKGIR